MGVKDLWTILSPVCERKSLWDLQEQTIAVDLSCWICDSQNVNEHSTQPRMYLRNLFFRTTCLVLLGVHPLFVLEGVAPSLKHNTMARRTEQRKQKDTVSASQTQVTKKGSRSRLQSLLRQCQELLTIMGLPSIQSPGEAEALCALLNQQGFVNGCITQDGDSFLYGAQTVYRNFTISPHAAGATRGFSVDMYKMSAIEEKLSLGRNKLIAISLLCGCDYNEKGVSGVGKESVMKFIDSLKDEEVLQRLKSWRTNSYFEDLERERTAVVKGFTCERCGHSGRRVKHDKSGCANCGLSTGCVQDNSRLPLTDPVVIAELNVRKKALLDPDFPSEAMLQEFLQDGCLVQSSKVNTSWRQPDLITFIKYSVKMLSWTETYAIEKFLPLVTRWQLHNKNTLLSDISKPFLIVTPRHITKKRIVRGVPSFEIQWSDDKNILKKMKLEDNISLETLLVTVEPQALVEDAFPDIVSAFMSEKEAKNKKGKRRVKAKDPCISNKKENEIHNHQGKLDDFVKKKKRPAPPTNNIEHLFRRLSLEPKENLNPKKIAGTQIPKTSRATTNEALFETQVKTSKQSKMSTFLTQKSSKLSQHTDVRPLNVIVATSLSSDADVYSNARDNGLCKSNVLHSRSCLSQVEHLNKSLVNEADSSILNMSCDNCELCIDSNAESDSFMDLSSIIDGIVGAPSSKIVSENALKSKNSDVDYKEKCDVTPDRDCSLIDSIPENKLSEDSSSLDKIKMQFVEKENIIEDEFDLLGDMPHVPLIMHLKSQGNRNVRC